MNAIESNDISKKSKRSLKWSLFAELFAKIATPLSTMFLARLLTPEIFGIATAVTMVVSFCEAITETGFSKYIIQHDFDSDEEYKKHISVSFISSIFLSILLCILIYFFRYPISSFIGNSGYEMMLVISCLQIPFTAFNAIFLAHLKRFFKFNTIFLIRIAFCIVPFLVTIPLAFLGLGVWSLVIGTIASQIIQTPFLLIASRRYIKFHFSFRVFAKMFSSSFAMIVESIIIWLCSWASTFLAVKLFNSYYVGIAKVANSTVNNIYNIFGTGYSAVLFSSLSRLKNDKEQFNNMFHSIQTSAFVIMIPLSIGSFFYSALITRIFLGNQWTDAVYPIAIFSISKCFFMCFNNFVSEVFRSKGHFYHSIFYQIIMLGINIGIKLLIGRNSFEAFVNSDIFYSIIITLVSLLVLQFKYGISFFKQIKTVFLVLACSGVMFPFLLIGKYYSTGLFQSVGQVFVCAFAYFIIGFVVNRKIYFDALSYYGLDRFIMRY